MRTFLGTIAFFALCVSCPAAAPQPEPTPPAPTQWWAANSDWRPTNDLKPSARTLPLIAVKGNHFVNAAGETVLFRGVAIADPTKLFDQGRWNRELFVAVKEFGANLVRLPVHPIAWRERTPTAYLALLDQAVNWCTELGMYVIIDWHSIGNLQSGLFQAPMYNTSVSETLAFWRTIAGHFHGHNTVAFYELFNEPSHINGVLGEMTWTQWRELNEQMIGVIRASDRAAIPLVAGFDWAYDLSAARYEPVRAEGIAYSVHPYEQKRSQPWEPKWEENFGFLAEKYPMMATEFGFDLKQGEVIDDAHYGNRITRYLEARGISWMAWCFDPQWGPFILKSFDGFALTESGAFFKQALHRPPVIAITKPAPKP
jgi:hypothetical protein